LLPPSAPLPPAAAERRRSRAGEPFRGHDYSGKRWRDDDLPALGWRHRRHYDMRATFITLAIEDGADADVIETRVTHTRKSRNAFKGYNRGLHWDRTCAEIAKLRITRGPRPEAIAAVIRGGGGSGSATADDVPRRSATLGEPSATQNLEGSSMERRGVPMVPPSTPATSTHFVRGCARPFRASASSLRSAAREMPLASRVDSRRLHDFSCYCRELQRL
jgi:hypothetical protein